MGYMNPPLKEGEKNLGSWQADLLSMDIVMEKARNSGYVKRLRKLNPVYLLSVLVFGISSHSKPSFEEVYRRYIDFDDTLDLKNKMKIQSFSNRFNEGMVKFLQEMLEYYIESTGLNRSAKLKGPIQDLKDILIQDSTILRLSQKLKSMYPALRSKSGAAGLKIHAVYSAISHSLKSIEISGERVHDSKMLKIGPDVKDVLLLFDLGYYSNSTFAKINYYGGLFVSRLKKNATPNMVKILSASSQVKKIFQKGMPLNDLLKKCPKTGKIDILCSFKTRFNPDGGMVKTIYMDFRVVCFWDEEASIWHTYVTNLPKTAYQTDDIYQLYRYRWIIELLFKELKGDYDLGNLHLAERNLAYAHIFSMLIRLVISRNLYKFCVQKVDKEERNRYGPLLWSKVFAEKAHEFLSILHQDIFGNGDVIERWEKLESSLRHLAKSRHEKYPRVSLQFLAF
jgi:IS4 transposase